MNIIQRAIRNIYRSEIKFVNQMMIILMIIMFLLVDKFYLEMATLGLGGIIYYKYRKDRRRELRKELKEYESK